MTPHPARLRITAEAPSRPWGILAVSVLTAAQSIAALLLFAG